MHANVLQPLHEVGPDAEIRHMVLVVDDDEQLTAVLSERLKRQGFDALAARRGSEGLALAREARPDLIVLDLRLPDADGLAVCQELADDPATCTIPVIILSGMERPDIIRRSREAGCQYYVRKPYDPNALLILIRQAIREARQWQDA
jgi:DNA-binding response OmpR family regulator